MRCPLSKVLQDGSGVRVRANQGNRPPTYYVHCSPRVAAILKAKCQEEEKREQVDTLVGTRDWDGRNVEPGERGRETCVETSRRLVRLTDDDES